MSFLNFVAGIGALVRTAARGLVPGNWRRTMRAEFGFALYQTGLRAVPAVAVAALLVGLGLVLQLMYWLSFAGQEERIGEFLVITLVRELAPIGAALIVIGRSGSVLVDEVGVMRREGQIDLLRACGVDPVDFIMIPRASACAVATFLLTMVFLQVSLWAAYLAAATAGIATLSPFELVSEVLGLMSFEDHLLLLVKPLLMGYAIGYLSVAFGLSVERSVHGIRRALPKAFVASLVAASALGALVSVVL